VKHLIIGTAGHVDHGKTTLVKALTGIDTDRLREEKERGISIELGFAQLALPGGNRAGLVDVPGHEKFIKNMLAGVGGIDMVMLVVAADEGVMPQTREHLDIVELLHVERGIVVLTKVDMVDEDWLELVREELRDYLKDTFLAAAPLVEVSAVTGQGLQELKETLARMAGDLVEKSAAGSMRLPVDRVFTITGFGTVATGTLVSGHISVGENVEVLPRRLTARVRSLQVHGGKVESAVAGQRVAVNLSGLEVLQAPRGSVLATPGSLKPSRRMDVKVTLLKSARELKNRARVRIYLGTAEILGRVVLLDRDEIDPGGEAYAQLELEENVAAGRGERFVVRSYSPMRTIGGGSVIEPVAKKHKRMKEEIINALATREKGTPAELVGQCLDSRPNMLTNGEIADFTGLSGEETAKILVGLTASGTVVQTLLEGVDYYASAGLYGKWTGEVTGLVGAYHRQYPLREGFPREELRSRKFTGLGQKQFQALLQAMEKDEKITTGVNSIALPGFEANPGDFYGEIVQTLEKLYQAGGCQPPFWAEAISKTALSVGQDQEILQYLIRRGVLVKVTDELYFHQDTMRGIRDKLQLFLREKGQITVGEARDLLGTSRKYALPLLEFFDREKVTKRVGDIRVPGRAL
jgi:selenocysteine-specific elongation factor